MSMNTLARGLCAAAAIGTLAVSLSVPANAAYPQYVKSACKSDFRKFCPKYDIDSSNLRQCMRSVARQLSPRCTESLERSGERRNG